MKRLIFTNLFISLVSVLLGWYFTSQHYQLEIAETYITKLEAQKSQSSELSKIELKWKGKLDEATNNPVIVTTERRVFVKADCPVREANPSLVADGGATSGIELDRTLVQNLERLTEEKEQQYRECSFRLRGVQEYLLK